MSAVIATYFNTEEKAKNHAYKMQKLWRGKIAWYVVVAKNGYFVISETVARACFPDLRFNFKERRYQKH